MDTSVSDALVGRLLSGRYRVGRRIARGGMATVYEAQDVRLERTVAIKVMHPDLAEDAGFVARFIGEARSAAKLSSPDVVAVYDQGEDAGWVYLAMEHVRGRTLRTVLRERGRLDPALTLEVLVHVLGALEEAHRAGIVHRDVKPENVLVATDGRVKVTDFGLARAVASTSTTTRGVLLGTVAYLSPEQALGRPATLRSDVYSTGVLAYELLTGVTPHQDATDYLVVRRTVEQDVPPPSALAPGTPAAVDALVLGATARDPERRYRDAGEFLAAVREARAGRPPRAAAAPDRVTTPVPVRAPAPVDPPAADPVRDTVPGGVALPGATGDEPRRPAHRPPIPRRRRRGRAGPVALLLALVLAVGSAGAAYWFGWARWTTTPAVLGLPAPQAERVLRSAGLAPVVAEERRYSETVPVGEVIGSDPAPGARALPDSAVRLVLSRGPQRFTVPRVTGLSTVAARERLARSDLVLGTRTLAYDDAVARGRVLSQATDPGTKVRGGTAVAVVVSRGRQPIGVPDLTGRVAADVRERLEGKGFRVATSEAYSDEVPEGRVVTQTPRGGTLFRRDEVRLVVSLGPETVAVPDVEGSGVDAARARLEGLRLQVRVVTFLPGGPGSVLRMSPAAGTELRRGETVTLYAF